MLLGKISLYTIMQKADVIEASSYPIVFIQIL